MQCKNIHLKVITNCDKHASSPNGKKVLQVIISRNSQNQPKKCQNSYVNLC